MKHLFAITLLLTLLIRPLYQLGHVAYYGLNMDYIIDTYCVNKERPKLNCDGKCYLMQQLSTTEENSMDDQKGVPPLMEVFFPIFFQSNVCHYGIYVLDSDMSVNVQITSFYTEPFQNIVIPPPKV